MVITNIQRAKKHLVEITLDYEQKVSIDEEAYLLAKPKIGAEISDTALETLQYRSDFIRAKNKALFLMGRRDYSQKELFTKLKPDFNADAVLEAIQLLVESGIVDDRRFAEIYAADLANLKGLSKRGIIIELVRKGIDREIAAETAEKYVDDEVAAIVALIGSKYYNCFADEKSYRRMFNALVRKGYGYSDIKKAINEYTEGEE